MPKAIGDFLILDAIRASGGTAIAVDDAELVAAVGEIGAATGLFVAPEGAACLPALRKLIARDSDQRRRDGRSFSTPVAELNISKRLTSRAMQRVVLIQDLRIDKGKIGSLRI